MQTFQNLCFYNNESEHHNIATAVISLIPRFSYIPATSTFYLHQSCRVYTAVKHTSKRDHAIRKNSEKKKRPSSAINRLP